MKVKDEEFIMCVRLGAGREERTSGGENCLCKNVWERDRDTERDGRETQRDMERETETHKERWTDKDGERLSQRETEMQRGRVGG